MTRVNTDRYLIIARGFLLFLAVLQIPLAHDNRLILSMPVEKFFSKYQTRRTWMAATIERDCTLRRSQPYCIISYFIALVLVPTTCNFSHQYISRFRVPPYFLETYSSFHVIQTLSCPIIKFIPRPGLGINRTLLVQLKIHSRASCQANLCELDTWKNVEAKNVPDRGKSIYN